MNILQIERSLIMAAAVATIISAVLSNGQLLRQALDDLIPNVTAADELCEG